MKEHFIFRQYLQLMLAVAQLLSAVVISRKKCKDCNISILEVTIKLVVRGDVVISIVKALCVVLLVLGNIVATTLLSSSPILNQPSL